MKYKSIMLRDMNFILRQWNIIEDILRSLVSLQSGLYECFIIEET